MKPPEKRRAAPSQDAAPFAKTRPQDTESNDRLQPVSFSPADFPDARRDWIKQPVPACDSIDYYVAELAALDMQAELENSNWRVKR